MFYQEVTNNGPAVGIWSSRREIDGVPAIVKVDLLVPAALGGAGRRAARIEGHEIGAVLKVPGLEGCLVDRSSRTIASLVPGDTRSFETMVAGPAALLVAKMIKLHERATEVEGGGRDRRKDKDALDVLRILRAISAEELAGGIALLTASDLSHGVTITALDALPEFFGTSNSLGSRMGADAAFPAEPREVTAASCAVLVAELLVSLG